MPVPILVATPHAAFGELLRLSLEENGQFQVRLVMSAKEARASLSRASIDLAIIDSDVSDESFTVLSFALLDQQPRLKLIIIPPDNNPNHPSMSGLIPHGYLSRPFYLPDLLETVGRLTQERQTSTPPAPVEDAQNSRPDWIGNQAILDRNLETELAHSDAFAALVGSNGELRGKAGNLTESAYQEMATVILRYWDPGEKTDLMRYVRLASTKGDYLVYATEVLHDHVLVMVFEPGAQLSQIRPQTKQIAHNLASRSPGEPPSQLRDTSSMHGSKNGSEEAKSAEMPLPKRTTNPAIIEPETEQVDDEGLYSLDGESFVDARGLVNQMTGSSNADPEEEIEPVDINLSMLLGAIPSPDPEKSAVAGQPTTGVDDLFSGWMPERGPWEPPRPQVTAIEDLDEHSAPGETQEVFADGEMGPAAQPFAQTSAEAFTPTGNAPHFLLDPEPEVDPLGDTRPHVVSTLLHLNQLEPVSPALSLLNYTCVLLPRMPQHYLTGELADRLAQWVQQLCLAFGWRLEGISLRPEYLQWTVQVAPSVSPGNLVRIIRQRTSIHIFSVFEQYKQQNPSGDFWATGYLIVSGPQPPSAQLLRDYILQTRKRQGIQKAA